MSQLHCFLFSEDVLRDEIDDCLNFARTATECLHGGESTRMHAIVHLNLACGVCVIDVNTSVGMDLNRIFVGILRRVLSRGTFATARVTFTTAA